MEQVEFEMSFDYKGENQGCSRQGINITQDRKSKHAKSKALAEIEGIAPMITVRHRVEMFNVAFRSAAIVRELYLIPQEVMNLEEGKCVIQPTFEKN